MAGQACDDPAADKVIPPQGTMTVEDIDAAAQALREELHEAKAHLMRAQRVPMAVQRAQAQLAASSEAPLAMSRQRSSHIRSEGSSSGADAETLTFTASEAAHAQQKEEAARRRIAMLHRHLAKARVAESTREVERANALLGEQMRAHARNDKLREALIGFTAASDVDMQILSETFNRRLRDVIPRPSPESWTKLFRMIDADGSGRITYDELVALSRQELAFLPSDISDAELKGIWLALDRDLSGYVSAGEFGQFMRRGADAFSKDKGSWRERLNEKNRLAAAQVRDTKGSWLSNDLQERLEGVGSASEGDMGMLARLCHSRLANTHLIKRTNEDDAAASISAHGKVEEMHPSDASCTAPSVQVLQKTIIPMLGDGKIERLDFAGFRHLVRDEMTISEDAFDDVRLKAVYLGMDRQGRGYIDASDLSSLIDRGDMHQTQKMRLRLVLARKRRAAALRAHDGAMRSRARAKRHEHMEMRRQEILDERQAAQIRHATAVAEVALAKRQAGKAVRDHAAQSWLRDALVGVKASPEHEVNDLAAHCNARMLELVSGDATRAQWFKFYRLVDTDGSGQISFEEFSRLLRDELQLTPAMMPEERLKSAWIALDLDASGLISAGEFGKFMRRGSWVLVKALRAYMPSWQDRRAQRARAAHEARRAEREAYFHEDIRSELACVPAASEDDVVALSEYFNRRLSQIGTPGASFHSLSMALFRHVDENGLGLISFIELQAIVRDALGLGADEVPDTALKSVWPTLDPDNSGFITAGVFLHFMRLGAPHTRDKRVSPLDAKRAIAMQQRATFDARAEAVKKRQALQQERRAQQYEEVAARLEAELRGFDEQRTHTRTGDGSVSAEGRVNLEAADGTVKSLSAVAAIPAGTKSKEPGGQVRSGGLQQSNALGRPRDLATMVAYSKSTPLLMAAPSKARRPQRSDEARLPSGGALVGSSSEGVMRLPKIGAK